MRIIYIIDVTMSNVLRCERYRSIEGTMAMVKLHCKVDISSHVSLPRESQFGTELSVVWSGDRDREAMVRHKQLSAADTWQAGYFSVCS